MIAQAETKEILQCRGWLDKIYMVSKLGSTFVPYVGIDKIKDPEALMMSEMGRIPMPAILSTRQVKLFMGEAGGAPSKFNFDAQRYTQLLACGNKGFSVYHYVTNRGNEGAPLASMVPVDIKDSKCVRLIFPVSLTSPKDRQIRGMCISLERPESSACFLKNEYTTMKIEYIPGLPKFLS